MLAPWTRARRLLLDTTHDLLELWAHVLGWRYVEKRRKHSVSSSNEHSGVFPMLVHPTQCAPMTTHELPHPPKRCAVGTTSLNFSTRLLRKHLLK